MPGNVQLKNRLGSPTSYDFDALRGPKLILLSIAGSSVHASKQLEGFMLAPSLSLHLYLQSFGKEGKSGGPTGPLGPAYVLGVRMDVPFHDWDGSAVKVYEMDVLGSLRGNASVPSHSRDEPPNESDGREALTVPCGAFGRERLAPDSGSAGVIGSGSCRLSAEIVTASTRASCVDSMALEQARHCDIDIANLVTEEKENTSYRAEI